VAIPAGLEPRPSRLLIPAVSIRVLVKCGAVGYDASTRCSLQSWRSSLADDNAGAMRAQIEFGKTITDKRREITPIKEKPA
jgi:hypothetical protein